MYFKTINIKGIKSIKQNAVSTHDDIQYVIYQVDNRFENVQHSEYLIILI